MNVNAVYQFVFWMLPTWVLALLSFLCVGLYLFRRFRYPLAVKSAVAVGSDALWIANIGFLYLALNCGWLPLLDWRTLAWLRAGHAGLFISLIAADAWIIYRKGTP